MQLEEMFQAYQLKRRVRFVKEKKKQDKPTHLTTFFLNARYTTVQKQ
jgi:hypothetical protein